MYLERTFLAQRDHFLIRDRKRDQSRNGRRGIARKARHARDNYIATRCNEVVRVTIKRSAKRLLVIAKTLAKFAPRVHAGMKFIVG